MEQQFVLSSGKLFNAVNSTHMGRCTVYVHRDTYELIAANILSHYVFLNKAKKYIFSETIHVYIVLEFKFPWQMTFCCK